MVLGRVLRDPSCKITITAFSVIVKNIVSH
jgi:hypothetical protein